MPLLSPEDLALTYNPPTDRDGWEQVQLYQQTQRYPDDWGGARVASAINGDDEQPVENISRSNVRVWVDGDGMPDAARAVEVADGLGWLADDWTPTTRARARRPDRAVVLGQHLHRLDGHVLNGEGGFERPLGRVPSFGSSTSTPAQVSSRRSSRAAFSARCRTVVG